MTLALDDELMREIRAHPEIRWTEVARQAFRMKIRELHAIDLAFENSKLTEEDVRALAEATKRSLHERYEKLYQEWKADDAARR